MQFPELAPIKPINLPDLKPIGTDSVPKKQSLQEWHAAGGGVPKQYKGREHVWHAKVKKFAEGGEAHMGAGGVMKGLIGAYNKADKAADAAIAAKKALPAAERDANLQKFLEPSKAPMRLYHGTTATEGGKGKEAIRSLKPSKEGALGSGVYLTPSSAHASGYSGIPNDEAIEMMLRDPRNQDLGLKALNQRNSGNVLPSQEGGNMLPVHAQIRNPLIIEGTHGDPMIEALMKLGMDEDKASRMVERAYDQKGYIGKEVESRARAAGYDGLMQYRNGDLSEVVSYNPNTIKSAIGNQGTYDTSIPDLNKARGGEVHMQKGGKSGALVSIAEAVAAASKKADEILAAKKAADEATKPAKAAKPTNYSPKVLESTAARFADKISAASPKLSDEEVAKKAMNQAVKKLEWERTQKPALEKKYGPLSKSSFSESNPNKMQNTAEVVAERKRKANEFLDQPTEPWSPPRAELQAFDRSSIKDALEGFPGVSQSTFPRDKPSRASTSHVEELYTDPENRALIEKQIKRGLPLGGESFYASLYPVKQAVLEAGMPAEKFDQWIHGLAPASARNSIMNEMAVGQFLRQMNARGIPLTEENVAREMAIYADKFGMGLPLMPVHREGVAKVLEGGLNLRDQNLANIPTNYKIPTYGSQKAGDFANSVVLDVHEAAGHTQGSRYHPYFNEQGGFGNTEYNAGEQGLLGIAKDLGIPGGMAQAGRWFGGGELTGLKSPRGDALDLLEKQVAYTLQQKGIQPNPANVRAEVLRQIETGEGDLLPWYRKEGMPDVRQTGLQRAEGGEIHKAEGGLIEERRFDGGGMAAADFAGPEDDGGSLDKAKLMTKILAEEAKKQGSKEAGSLSKPRALTDLLNRGVLANNPISAGIDLLNMGLIPLDILGSKLTGRDIKVSSDKPFLGSEYVKDLMNKYNVTSGEERPMMETALSFASPAGMVKGAMKAPGAVTKVTEALTSSKMPPLATEAKTAQAGKPTGATYATKQDGPFYRVSQSTPDQSSETARGVREADGLQAQGAIGAGPSQTGQRVPKQFSDEEVAGLIASPNNKPLKLAQSYTKEQRGADFMTPKLPASSLAKQSAIGRTHMAAVEGSPAYKNAIFDAYAQSMPDVLQQAGAKNYDDLLEKAYRQLAKETSDQFDRLPVSMSFHKSGEGNYNGAREMASDVHGNDHLYVFQGGDKHDFLNQVDPRTGLNENEKFRAVHDLFGHAIRGNEFGPAGEEKAWGIHKQMYSPLAQLAMTAETRGQNSVVNYTPLNARLKAEVSQLREIQMEAKRRGDTQRYKLATEGIKDAFQGFQYAPQKAILLPPEYVSADYKGGMPDYVRKLITPEKGTETQSILTHYSNKPDLKFTDPKRYGTGIKGAEAERLTSPSAVRDRSYFYMGEPGTVSAEPGLGVNRYRGEASSLYDITQDPLDFRVLARESNRTPYTSKYNQGVTSPLQDANDMERLVREYGYQGMANPKASKPMAIMFDQTPVERYKRGGLSSIK